jgi:hypothetical protein
MKLFRPPAANRAARRASHANHIRPALEHLEGREVPSGTGFLQGTVYLDANANGVIDPADTPRAGAVVKLYSLGGPTDATPTLEASFTTGPDGQYLFSNLDPGDYRIVDETPNIVPTAAAVSSPLYPASVGPAKAIDVTVVDTSALAVTNALRPPTAETIHFTVATPGNPPVDLYQFVYQRSMTASGGGLAGPVQFPSFCVNLDQHISSPATFTADAEPLDLGVPYNAGRIGYLYNHYGATPIASDADAAALQIAIWELEYDPTPDLSSGNFVYGASDRDDAAILARAQFLLADSAGKGEDAVYLRAYLPDPTGNGMQSMIAAGMYNLAGIPAVSITTTQNPAAVTLTSAAPPVLRDSATLSGGSTPTGTITFTLYSPSNTAVDTETVTVNGAGTYTTPAGYTMPTTGTVTGTYQWVAAYSGDAVNAPATTAVGDEPVVVSPAHPAITTTPGQYSTTTGTGTFATIGFWHNQNGQALIKSLDTGPTSTMLGNGLAGGYANLFGKANPYTTATLGAAPGVAPGLAGLSNAQVAAVYLGTWKPSGLQKNTYVQAFAVALGSYAGGGAGTFNVGGSGAAFGVANNTTLPIGQILTVANANFNATTGQFYNGDQTLTSQLNTVLDGINTSGETPGGPTVVSTTTKLIDSATLTGGYSETGTLTFTLYGPSNAVVYTDVVAVNGNGTYTTLTGSNPGGYLPAATGTYQWVVVYNGDGNNAGVTSPFGSEPWTVGTQTPAIITTVPTPTAVTLGTGAVVLRDTATLQDGNGPTGTITFTLVYNTVTVYSETVTVSGNGNYTTAGYTLPTNTAVTGTYQWNASYSGDTRNAGDSETNSPDERVVVSPAQPAICTTPGGTVLIGSGQKLSDSATLTGGYSETGTLTFTLYGPSNAVVYTDVVAVNGNGTYTTAAGSNPGGYLPTAAGTYQWVVVYGGNGNNAGVTSPFGSEPESVGSQPPTPIQCGDFATIGFWHNQNGQALIKSLNGGPTSTALAQWLVGNFPNLYGPGAGATKLVTPTNTPFTNAQVAAAFLSTAFFGASGQKTNAQVLAGALAAYATSTTLAGGTTAAGYGFHTSAGGTGLKTYNVGSNGSALGLANNSAPTVLQLLSAVNTAAANGLSSAESNAANVIFSGINQSGDITLVTDGSASDTASQVLASVLTPMYTGTLVVAVDTASENDPADQQPGIAAAIATLNAELADLGVTVVQITGDASVPADVHLGFAGTTVIGGVGQGVLGVTTLGGSQITIVTGWNFYYGSDPTAVGAGQYDFQTVITHELGHALGLGHSTSPTSVMYPYLGTASAHRTLTADDLALIAASEDGSPEPLLAMPGSGAGGRVGPAAADVSPAPTVPPVVSPVTTPAGAAGTAAQVQTPVYLASAVAGDFAPVVVAAPGATAPAYEPPVGAQLTGGRPTPPAGPVVVLSVPAAAVGFDTPTTTSAPPVAGGPESAPAQAPVGATPGVSGWSTADAGMSGLSAVDIAFEPIVVDAVSPVVSGTVDGVSEVALVVGAMTGLYYVGRTPRRSPAGRLSPGPDRAEAV